MGRAALRHPRRTGVLPVAGTSRDGPGAAVHDRTQVAYPGRQCIAFVGDGGFAMLMARVPCRGGHGLPIKVVVCNNGLLGQILWEQMALGYPEYSVRPAAHGLRDVGRVVRRAGDPVEKSGTSRAPSGDVRARRAGPARLVVNADEPPMPPKVTYEQAKKFAEAFLRGQPRSARSRRRSSGTSSTSCGAERCARPGLPATERLSRGRRWPRNRPNSDRWSRTCAKRWPARSGSPPVTGRVFHGLVELPPDAHRRRDPEDRGGRRCRRGGLQAPRCAGPPERRRHEPGGQCCNVAVVLDSRST